MYSTAGAMALQLDVDADGESVLHNAYFWQGELLMPKGPPNNQTACVAGAIAREMDDLILLDSILRDPGKVTRANGALPSPGVSCRVTIDRNLSFSGMRIGIPMNFWATLDPAVSLSLSQPSLTFRPPSNPPPPPPPSPPWIEMCPTSPQSLLLSQGPFVEFCFFVLFEQVS